MQSNTCAHGHMLVPFGNGQVLTQPYHTTVYIDIVRTTSMPCDKWICYPSSSVPHKLCDSRRKKIMGSNKSQLDETGSSNRVDIAYIHHLDIMGMR